MVQAGDREQRGRAEVPAHAQGHTIRVEVLLVQRVDRDLLRVEARHEAAVGAEDVGAEQASRALEITHLHAEQGVEVLARLQQQLAAERHVVVALDRAVAARAAEGVVHPIAAALVKRRHAAGQRFGKAAADGGFGVHRVVLAVREPAVARGLEVRTHRIELDEASRRIAAEQRALRAAQHLDAVDVEHREALQRDVLEHDVVVHQRHRLRGVQVEVGVAEAAQVEAREHAAERGFDVEAGRTRREKADVITARADGVELLAVDRADCDGHLLGVLGATGGGHRDGVQRRGVGGGVRGGGILRRREGRQGQGDGEGQRMAGQTGGLCAAHLGSLETKVEGEFGAVLAGKRETPRRTRGNTSLMRLGWSRGSNVAAPAG